MRWFVGILVGLVLRHGLTGLGLLLMHEGLIEAEEWERVRSVLEQVVSGGCDPAVAGEAACRRAIDWWAGVAAVVIGAAWSVWQKWRTRQQRAAR